MKTVNEIEKELSEDKDREGLVFLEKELVGLKQDYEAKAFGSHTFERKNRSTYMSASFYEKFWIEDGKIKTLVWHFNINRIGKNYTFSSDTLSIHRGKSEKVSENNGYHAQYNLMGHSYEKKEVTVSKFMEIWECGAFIHTKLNETIMSTGTFDVKELLRIGSASDDVKLQKAFDTLKLDYIDITKNPKVFNTLQYLQLPFFQEQKYFPRIYAKDILNYQISLWELEKANIWCTQIEYINRNIKIIQDFIKTI